ncbi:MAG: CocE/NonD family hydrolase [Armatimonadetes bacterium]|nr:CocE/NonD family hydrolase [Armatimonadota bacterium]
MNVHSFYWTRSLKARVALLLAAVVVVVVSGVSLATQPTTTLVPMRDGVKLATDVYLPGDGCAYPVILVRTPYDKNKKAPIGLDGARRGYAMVIQDCRGRFASQGKDIPFETDIADGFDTLEWIARQPWWNGKIGTWGGSALGITQFAEAASGTNRITCQHIAVANPLMYLYGICPGGVFKKAMIEDWLSKHDFGQEALALWKSHPLYDSYWRAHDLLPRLKCVTWPAVHFGGWYDIFSQGMLDSFAAYNIRGRGKQKLIMGPWTHGGPVQKSGELIFPNADKPPAMSLDSWRWFDHYLKGMDNGIESDPAVTYYVMGDTSDPAAPGNVWRKANDWPPFRGRPTRFYLQAGGGLSRHQPTVAGSIGYICDPADPVPTIGGTQLTIPAGPMDQRKIESRSDVLIFTSEPLARPLEVTGRVGAVLWVSTDAPDMDFLVRLCDVYPDGRSINVCEGILRASLRDTLEKTHLLKPGKQYKLKIDLWSTSIIFNKGHRIRVHVTSSSYPGFDTGAWFHDGGKARVARNMVYMSRSRPSYVLLPVVE